MGVSRAAPLAACTSSILLNRQKNSRMELQQSKLIIAINSLAYDTIPILKTGLVAETNAVPGGGERKCAVFRLVCFDLLLFPSLPMLGFL
jgi:hypothetical protein